MKSKHTPNPKHPTFDRLLSELRDFIAMVQVSGLWFLCYCPVNSELNFNSQ